MSFLRRREIYRSDEGSELRKRQQVLPRPRINSLTVAGKVERISSMSFLRHKEIYRSDVVGTSKGRQLTLSPFLIVSMSFQLAIPGGLLSSRARFRFTNRG